MSYTHLSYNERLIIAAYLEYADIKRITIANALKRDPKTITLEILKHRYLSIRKNQRNKCGRQNDCIVTRLCEDCAYGQCKFCRHDNCNQICGLFSEFPVCERVTSFPYVCNGCPNIKDCTMPKYLYKAPKADKEYHDNISHSEYIPRISDNDLAVLSSHVKDGVERGLSVDIIAKTSPVPISTSTLYNYIDRQVITTVKNIDLKRKVTYSKRRQKIIPVNHDYLTGRKYSDFLERIQENPSLNIWQMDTVHGKKSDSKVVLSLHNVKSNLQLYFLLNNCDTLSVNKVFSSILNTLGDVLFKETFTIILTDNGSEFSNPLAIETNPLTGEKLISVYFCEPRRSDQKGKCEKNHEHFRELFPKGRSLDNLSQTDINRVSLMVNNYPRKILNYSSPYQVATIILNEKVLALNNLRYVSLDKLKLKPIISR